MDLEPSACGFSAGQTNHVLPHQGFDSDWRTPVQKEPIRYNRCPIRPHRDNWCTVWGRMSHIKTVQMGYLNKTRHPGCRWSHPINVRNFYWLCWHLNIKKSCFRIPRAVNRMPVWNQLRREPMVFKGKSHAPHSSWHCKQLLYWEKNN